MSNGTQELVTIIPWTFIAQILNLFIQVYLIKRFLFKPINEVLEKRRQLADQEIKEAREAKEAADSLKVQYEEGLAGAKAEAAQIVQSAQKEAQIKADETLKQAQEQAAGIRRKAEADIAQEKKKAINEERHHDDSDESVRAEPVRPCCGGRSLRRDFEADGSCECDI